MRLRPAASPGGGGGRAEAAYVRLVRGILGREVRVFAIVAIVAGILAGVGAAAGLRPSIRIVRTHPLVVAGSRFRTGERVTVTAHALRRVVRQTVARNGSFRVNLGSVPIAKCVGTRIDAVGSRGSRATRTIPQSSCKAAWRRVAAIGRRQPVAW